MATEVAAQQKKSRKNNILFWLLILLGFAVSLGLLFYPAISNFSQQLRMQHAVAAQATVVSEKKPKDLSAEWQKANEYNQKLAQGSAKITDPFDSKSQNWDDKLYSQSLNLAGDGIMASIAIPKLKLELPIYHSSDTAALEQGVGHLNSSSLPVGGKATHVVLAGHNGLPKMKVFDDIDELAVGDEFAIKVLGETHVYRIYKTEVVLPTETDSLLIDKEKDLVTLVTCTPYGINSHRLLVHAERVEGWSKQSEKQLSGINGQMSYSFILPLALFVAALLFGGLIYHFLFIFRKRKKTKENNSNMK